MKIRLAGDRCGTLDESAEPIRSEVDERHFCKEG